MQLGSQLTWQLGWRADMHALAVARAAAMRNVAVAASMQDGTGIGGVRSGAYSLGDVVLLCGVMPPHSSKRIAELEQRVLPLQRDDVQGLRTMAKRFGS